MEEIPEKASDTDEEFDDPELVRALKISRAEALTRSGRTKVGEGASSKTAEETSTGTYDTLVGTIKPILPERSTQIILEDESRLAEDITKGQS